MHLKEDRSPTLRAISSCTKSSFIQTRENEIPCRGFIKAIACSLFNEDIRKKLIRVKFIVTLIDSATDRAVKEQEDYRIIFVDSDTHKPTFVYFQVLESDDFGQTTLGLMAVFKNSFKENKLTELRLGTAGKILG